MRGKRYIDGKKHENTQVKPAQILLFVLSVMIMLALISFFFPPQGIAVFGVQLEFPALDEIFRPETKPVKNIALILDEDTLPLAQADTSKQRKMADSLRKISLHIQYPQAGKKILYPFFRALDRAGSQKVRVMHYGDSQIEGDRMTSYIRNTLQTSFGGYGPGLLPAVRFVRSLSIEQQSSDNFIRHTIFGRKDTTVRHNRYGVLGNFGSYVSQTADSVISEAWLRFARSKLGYGKTRSFAYCKMFYGHNASPVMVQFEVKGKQPAQAVIRPSDDLQTMTWRFNSTPDEFRIVFRSESSPEIYGIALESERGVVVDNIAMRGSAGTVFSKMDRDLLRKMYDSLDVRLLIMQFGGNVMPYIKDEKKSSNYGRWFESQLRLLKSLIPQVCIIVIGPSDMSVKEKGRYVTYPYLEKVRDAMKQAAFNTNSAFWDMYEAMGGHNSMPAWVSHDPPLAATDYTHFSPSGIKKIAQWFTRALMDDYKAYKQQDKKQ